MDNQTEQQFEFSTTEEERAVRRAQRIKARRQRQRAQRRKLLLRTLAVCLVLIVAGVLLWFTSREQPEEGPAPGEEEPAALAAGPMDDPADEPEPEPEEDPPFSAAADDATVRLGEEMDCSFAVLIDLEEGKILAEKDADTVISPASMTKILTVLVAAEQIEDLNDTAPITQEITDYCFRNDCSVAGFLLDEEVPLGSLFYGAILPSGADAALALANYAAGSQEAFVALMNEKMEELGLARTAHFANCVGLYDGTNVCTVYDMAMILKAAMDNELCRQVLTQRIFDIPASDAHPEGMSLSNWFIRRIEDHMPADVQILGGKTGFVNESGNCAASIAQDASGKRYICVTAQGTGIWRCIFDHVALYRMVSQAEPSE